TGMIQAVGDGRGSDEARPEVTGTPPLAPLPPVPSASPPPTPAPPSATPPKKPPPNPPPPRPATQRQPASASPRLSRPPEPRRLPWVRAHPGDQRRAVIESRIADRPAAVWFADYTPDTVTARVRAATSGGAAQGRVPVLVPYAIPDRDCGRHSQGRAPERDAYDGWIDRFAAGRGR